MYNILNLCILIWILMYVKLGNHLFWPKKLCLKVIEADSRQLYFGYVDGLWVLI